MKQCDCDSVTVRLKWEMVTNRIDTHKSPESLPGPERTVSREEIGPSACVSWDLGGAAVNKHSWMGK